MPLNRTTRLCRSGARGRRLRSRPAAAGRRGGAGRLIANRAWVVLAALLLWILRLAGGLRLRDGVASALATPVAAATILGMTIGKLLSRPGHGFRIQQGEED